MQVGAAGAPQGGGLRCGGAAPEWIFLLRHEAGARPGSPHSIVVLQGRSGGGAGRAATKSISKRRSAGCVCAVERQVRHAGGPNLDRSQPLNMSRHSEPGGRPGAEQRTASPGGVVLGRGAAGRAAPQGSLEHESSPTWGRSLVSSSSGSCRSDRLCTRHSARRPSACRATGVGGAA